jgi:hypothetical protein
MSNKRTFNWLMRIWPVYAELIIIGLHLLIRYFYQDSPEKLHQLIGALLQAAGALTFVLSLNSTIGTFHGYGIVGAIKLWWADRTWIPLPSITLKASNSSQTNVSGSGRITISGGTPDERLSNLEKQVGKLLDSISDLKQAMNQQKEFMQTQLKTAIDSQTTKVNNLTAQVKDTLANGYHVQIFGILLTIHGTFAGYFELLYKAVFP